MVYPGAIKPDRKKTIMMIAVIFLAIVIIAFFGYLAWKKWIVKPIVEPTLAEKQAKELDDLRAAAGNKQWSEAELATQASELDQAKNAEGNKVASKEDIDKQATEIDALRN